MQLNGRVAIVTGAAQGIGAAIARAYAAEGAKVALVDRKDAQPVVQDIEDKGGTALAITCDVADRADVNRALAAAREALGPADVLVSNAGITRPAMLTKMTDADWDDVLAVNLTASFYLLQAVVPDMIEAGRGSIVMTSSSTAQNGSVSQINYAAAKAGMLGLMRSAAKELGRHGIRVNAVAPSAATEMTREVMTNPRFNFEAAIRQLPLRRMAEPEEIAATYVFLASDASSYTTGQVLSVDGGGMLVR
ncbi:3-oxoacyl-ACP reductase FabG [Nonomuraea sp. NPDC046570]|uniref:SDR family NAD(P)-dependent oxidoreductase n=1 Tax=Nonomuraea sp. NPDC046570 TaxID=3155255 RepID=UPI0034013DE5